MEVEQFRWSSAYGWQDRPPRCSEIPADIVFIFGAKQILDREQCFEEIRCAYPNALLFGCSTAGEISDTQVHDHTLSIAAVRMSSTKVAASCVKYSECGSSYDVGKALASKLNPHNLRHVLVLATSKGINGSALTRGLTGSLPKNATLTGGLAANSRINADTSVVCNDISGTDIAAALGFYGQQLSVGYASVGGWDPFGPERLVTQSRDNVLYELDGRSALELYKRYLGNYAAGLPSTGLFFPLSLRSPDGKAGIVRSVQCINEEDQSIISGGDIPVGSYARMMLGNYDHLVEGAVSAATISRSAIGQRQPDLVLAVSCSARRMVLRQRIEEEIEAVREIMGSGATLTGFYSHGEIAPLAPNTPCEFHNQSITLTAFREVN